MGANSCCGVAKSAISREQSGQYAKTKKVFWWSIEQGHPIPSGLQFVYDGEPEGHCTLTVTREMTVKGFLELVGKIVFLKRDIDLIAKLP